MKTKEFVRGFMAASLLGIGVAVGVMIGGDVAQLGPPAEAAGSNTAISRTSFPGYSDPGPIARVAEYVSPSVVTVGAVKSQIVRRPGYDEWFRPFVSYHEQKTRIPYMGSGFVIDREGHVLTNHHVIDDSEELFVTFSDGREFKAQLVDADRYVDVALLKIDADGEELPEPLEFADLSEVRIGEEVAAFGNPFGNLIQDARPTVTAGVVSALNRSFQPDHEHLRVYTNMIQTDAAINPGNSGGPLVDLNGDVVGVNTFIFSNDGTSSGISFAIPGDRVKNFVDEVRTYGRLRPLLLDFAFDTIRRSRQTAVQIFDVEEGGPAELAGLRPGDLLIEADGRNIKTRQDFYLLFASKQVGDKVGLKYVRNGDVKETVYEIAEAQKRRVSR